MAKLDQQDITTRLEGSDWALEDDQLVREWSFSDFENAVEFIDRVAAEAQVANHHPDILLHDWNRVRLSLSTHSEGGITQADFDLASRIDPLAALFD